MPITSSAKKALRGSLRKQVINNRVRSRMKTSIDAFRAQPEANALSQAFSSIDRAVKVNLLHRNTAARRKSLLARLFAGVTK
jgi:small subunit ribosomal protein S20